MARSDDNRQSRKRVCIVRHYHYDLLVRREAETLRDAGYDVDVVCLRPASKEKAALINGVHMHYIPLTRKKGGIIRYLFDYFSFFFLVALKLTRLHLQRPFAAIQVNNMPDFLVFATLVPRILGAKATMVMYEPSPELWATKYSAPYLIKSISFIEQMSFRYANAVFAVTAQMKQAFVSRGADAEKIRVILNVTDDRFFEEGAVKEAHPANEHFTLICHGAIEERYGHDTMLQAIKRVRSQIPGVQLRILGSGGYLEKFLSQIAEMDLEDHVRYLGFVPLAEMVKELKGADVGIVAQKSSPYSNLVHTGKMYDYLSLGLPGLVSRLKAVEAYFNEDALRFFEPGDPDSLAEGILDLYQHPEKRQSLVKNSQRLYEEYRWDRQKEIYLSVYRDLLDEFSADAIVGQS
jgi:glycosyltransferase involved in cell wall biosynthesis